MWTWKSCSPPLRVPERARRGSMNPTRTTAVGKKGSGGATCEWALLCAAEGQECPLDAAGYNLFAPPAPVLTPDSYWHRSFRGQAEVGTADLGVSRLPDRGTSDPVSEDHRHQEHPE